MAVRKCSQCELPGQHRPSGRFLCDMHERFRQMRAKAHTSKKYVPKTSELEAVHAGNMICPNCKVTMCWFSKEDTKRVASLQHYRDGAIGIVCHSCNRRHGAVPGDEYENMPQDHKRCPKCNEVKPMGDFHNSLKLNFLRVGAYCKPCKRLHAKEWALANPERNRAIKDRQNDAARLKRANERKSK